MQGQRRPRYGLPMRGESRFPESAVKLCVETSRPRMIVTVSTFDLGGDGDITIGGGGADPSARSWRTALVRRGGSVETVATRVNP